MIGALIHRDVIRHHREMSHYALKHACGNKAFKRRLISHLGQMQLLAPLLTSITLKQLRGLIEGDRDLYAFTERLPKPNAGLWVELTTVKIASGNAEIYYKLDLTTSRLDPFTFKNNKRKYETLYQYQETLLDPKTHYITRAMIRRQLHAFNPTSSE